MTSKLNVLIIGSGGREHALAWKLSSSPRIGKLFVAPGNAGTAAVATNVPLEATDKLGLVKFAKANEIGLTVVGPDGILAIGMVDAFQAAGLRAFGPTQSAARIESSKAFSKELMTRQKVPTAAFKTFSDQGDASAYLGTRPLPLVIKASGLALGKGVYICRDHNEAAVALEEIMGEKRFGESGSQVVIEDFLGGQEVSIHAFSDGRTASLFPPSQDHKQVNDGDAGPNTGGMGTFAPVPWFTPSLMRKAKAVAVAPILAGLSDGGSPFVGVLYPGLMVDGPDIKVLEYNCRFGDPEVQSYVRLLDTDLLDILSACVDGTLSRVDVQWSQETAVTVVLTSGGYPDKYETGLPITGVEAAESEADVVVFHAGTKVVDGQLLTSGGRVLNVTATGSDLREARAKVYAAIKRIHFKGMHYRSDIGSKALL